jgi:3-hydroxyisobutyrate dehydrogenase
MTNVAVLGTGRMGAAMARRLLATGHPVAAWNRTPGRAAGLGEAGATVATTPGAAVAGTDLVITMLTDANAVEAVLFGDGSAASAAAGLRPGALVVQMSTIGPDEVRAIAARLPDGVALLDAPVAGSVGAAEAGTLRIFAGGSDDVVDRAEPVLRDLGTIVHCGQVGSGAALKLVANTALVTALGGLHDALAVADAVGVDRAVALGTLAAGPLGGAIQRLTAPGAAFAISLAAKDARLALRTVPHAPVATATLDLLRAAPDQDADIATLVDLEAT